MLKLLTVAIGSFIVGLLLQPAPIHQTSAQDDTDQLPADLIFTTGEVTTGNWESSDQNILMYLNAETLEVTPFYIDDEAFYVRAVSWSPDGELLAILRILPAAPGAMWPPKELCLLNRLGQMERCFEEQPPLHLEEGQVYSVTWSADSQKIYYVSENVTGDYTGIFRLIEANAATGKTLRVLYEFSKSAGELPSNLAWSPDFSSIVFGVDYNMSERVMLNMFTGVLNRATGEQLDLTSVVPKHTTLSYICPQLSPQGTYLVARAGYNPTEYDPGSQLPDYVAHLLLTIVYDYRAGTQVFLGEPDGEDTFQFMNCPVWQDYEKAFFIVGYNIQRDTTAIFKYILEQQTLRVFYDGLPTPDLRDPLVLSPNGTHIAFRISRDDPKIGVVSPSGEIQIFSDPYEFGLYPIWVPPALSE